jgi:glyoxylase I family protein
MAISIEGLTPLLQVFDLPTSLSFYRDAFGLKVVGETEDWAWLQGEGVELMLNTLYERDERPPEPDPKRKAIHRDVILFFGSPDVESVYEHLKAMGLEVTPPKVAPYGMKQITLHDPDGYEICVQWPAAEGSET